MRIPNTAEFLAFFLTTGQLTGLSNQRKIDTILFMISTRLMHVGFHFIQRALTWRHCQWPNHRAQTYDLVSPTGAWQAIKKPIISLRRGYGDGIKGSVSGMQSDRGFRITWKVEGSRWGVHRSSSWGRVRLTYGVARDKKKKILCFFGVRRDSDLNFFDTTSSVGVIFIDICVV